MILIVVMSWFQNAKEPEKMTIELDGITIKRVKQKKVIGSKSMIWKNSPYSTTSLYTNVVFSRTYPWKINLCTSIFRKQ